MAGHTRVAIGYNAQLEVDAKHKLIVEQEITNQVVDMGLLKQTGSRRARSSALSGSTSSPIVATSRSRTSKRATKKGSRPCPQAAAGVGGALANKMARTLWAMMVTGEVYRRPLPA
jgi:hypothetical protein